MKGRWLIMCVLPISAYAAQEWPVPVQAPIPPYPTSLVETGYTGKVRALLKVSSDGSIADVKVIESMHPALAESVEQTLVHWRFRPWTAAPAAPAQVAFTLPVIFGSPGQAHFASHVDVGLANIRCDYVNHEVSAQRRDFPNAPLGHVDVFWYTMQFLRSDYAALRRDSAERKTLLGQLQSALPGIVKRCASQPHSRYGEHLPAPVRQLLVDLDEAVEPQRAS